MAYRAGGLVLLLLPLLLAGGCGGEGGTEGAAVEGEAREAAGSASGAGSDDLLELESYELSMEDVDRYYAAYRNVGRASARMTPEERERNEAAMDASDDADLDEYAARIESNPVWREAIEEAGISAREFAVITLAMLQAAMAQTVIQMRPEANADSLAREMQANPANIRFMREHAAEIQSKQQALQQEFDALGISDDE